MDGLHGRVRLGVEREAAGGDRQPPEVGGPVGGVRGVVGDLSVRGNERVPGASGGMGGCLDGPRPGTRFHLDHVLWWRIGEALGRSEP